jgi:hypothetical protein
VRKLADHLAHNRGTGVPVSRERLRQLLRKHDIALPAHQAVEGVHRLPNRGAWLAWIEQVTNAFPDRVFAFEEFGPLAICPHGGAGWAPAGHPERLPANYHKQHGVREFHGYCSISDD